MLIDAVIVPTQRLKMQTKFGKGGIHEHESNVNSSLVGSNRNCLRLLRPLWKQHRTNRLNAVLVGNITMNFSGSPDRGCAFRGTLIGQLKQCSLLELRFIRGDITLMI